MTFLACATFRGSPINLNDGSQRPAGRISQSIQFLPQLFRCEQGSPKFADATDQVRGADHFFNLADDGATDDGSICKTPDFAYLLCGRDTKPDRNRQIADR